MTKEEIAEKNQKFLNLQKNWKSNHNEKDWNEMFEIAYYAILNTLKKKAGGKRFDLEELAMDGVVILMDRIKNGTKKNKDYWVEYLPTCSHYIVLKLLYNPQQQFEDRITSLDEYEERNEWDDE